MATLQTQLLLATIVVFLLLPFTTAIWCASAKSFWQASDVESCDRQLILVDDGNGTLDLTGWTAGNFKKVFEDDEKFISGGIKIDNSTLATIEMALEPVANDTKITVTNCVNLQTLDLGLSVREGYAVPILHISGNRKLLESVIEDLWTMITEDHIVSNESYIQVANECKLQDPNGTVNNAVNDLAGCKAIYGDFRITAQTVLPTELTQIGQLSYIQGCLEISGTNIARFDDLTFLTETVSKPGGCKSQHKIVNNPKMCIHPPQSHELEQRFPKMSISGNENCDGECPSEYVLKHMDDNCKIITDSLLITNHAGTNLTYLKNVKEIKGTLEIVGTSIENFTFLNNLEKLNTDNISVGVVLSLKYNHNLKTFDLPKLTAIPVSADQLAVYEDSNGNFKLAESFRVRLGVDDKNSIRHTAEPNTTTSAPTTTTVATKSSNMWGKHFDDWTLSEVQKLLIGCYVVLGIVVFPIILWCCDIYSIRGTKTIWKHTALKEEDFPKPIGPIIHFVEKDFMNRAQQKINEYAVNVIKLDEAHKKNAAEYKKLTFPNGDAPCFFATPEEKADFDEHDSNRDGAAFPALTVNLPAQINGQYGIRFIEQAEMTDEIQLRTQCDAVAFAWNKSNLQPVYVELFTKTAKRMVHLASIRLSDGLRAMEKVKKVQGFGIDFSMVEKILTKRNSTRRASDLFQGGRVISAHWTDYYFHRYRSDLDVFNTPEDIQKFKRLGKDNKREFIKRMVTYLLNMPQGQQLNLEKDEVELVLRVTYPVTIGRPSYTHYTLADDQSNGDFSVNMNRRHVRIVGETRGDFEALRKALSIPSIIDGDAHALTQYSWVFLGNYTSSHPQSLETILLLLGLQCLFGSDSVVLLRGALEFEEMSEKYGFKKLLEDRFGSKDGDQLWQKFIKIFATLPLNCEICQQVCCTSGGFGESDIEGNFRDGKERHQKQCIMDSTNYNKVFSLPNYTVKYFYDNVESWAGYYFGERLMSQISKQSGMVAYFTTAPMECGLGLFGDSMASYLFALSSVKGLKGFGGQTTNTAVVAEVNAETERITFHAILEDDEIFAYDRTFKQICRDPRGAGNVHKHTVPKPMAPSKEEMGDNDAENYYAPSKEALDKEKGAKKKDMSKEEPAKSRSREVMDRTKSKEVLSQTKSKENFSKSKETL